MSFELRKKLIDDYLNTTKKIAVSDPPFFSFKATEINMTRLQEGYIKATAH